MSLPSLSLEGRVALVTGASRGLGLAMARGLAQAGAMVVLNGRDEGSLVAARDRFTAEGLQANVAAFDVTDHAAARMAIDAIAAHHGRFDILLANAGIAGRADLGTWTLDAWNTMIAANLTACFFLAEAAARHMMAAKSGRLIFTTSITGLRGRSTIHAYAASKAGLASVARSLAAELGPHGITSNAICPGYFATDLNAALKADKAFDERVVSRTALKRWGEPHELAGAAVLLASDAGAYITGQEIVVDGGFTGTM